MRQRGDTVGFEVHVGGGQGRTPVIASRVNEFVPEDRLLDYLEAIMRVYNLHGRRDNKYKARIKILVTELGEEEFTRQVEAEFASQKPHEKIDLPREEIDRIHAYFARPDFPARPEVSDAFEAARASDAGFARWVKNNLHPHFTPGYTSVTISLKPVGGTTGDATAAQMETVADLAETYGFGDVRVTHTQNLILPHVALDDLPAIFADLVAAGIATPNEGLITDMIVCPGLDFCTLANARSIPVGQAVQQVFADPDYQEDIGRLHLNISGCINACGHHHIGHIGILGVDKKGEEFYQISFGGRADEKAAIGDITGPGLKSEEVPGALKRVIDTYRSLRSSKDEIFIDTLTRLGHDPFKEALYATD
jgi:sulfite reductase (NADPH) hemoprotein beta-component